MRCFVTGATGQVGSALLRRLAQDGHQITALVLPGDPWADAALAGLPVARAAGDVTDPASLPDAPFDWVFHLAANQSFWRGDEARQRAVNVDGTRAMLAWAQGRAARFVHVSSLAAVGLADRPGEIMNEAAVVQPASAALMYAESKRAAERLALRAAGRGVHAAIGNLGAVLGPWDRGGHALRMLRPLMHGPLRVAPAGGLNVVDVRDAAEGLVSLARRGARGRRYLLAGHNLTYAALSDLGALLLGSRSVRVTLPSWTAAALAHALDLPSRWFDWRPPVTPDDAAVGARFLYVSNARAVRELGFRIRPVAATIADAIAWYRAAGVWR